MSSMFNFKKDFLKGNMSGKEDTMSQVAGDVQLGAGDRGSGAPSLLN